MTDLERQLAWYLGRMVLQSCSDYDPKNRNHCFSGFIRAHSDAMRLLVKLGLMVADYPEMQDRDCRGFYAYFVPDWERKLEELEADQP